MMFVSLFFRSLLMHLLLIVLYLSLGLAWLGHTNLPIWLVGLVGLAFGLNGAWVMLKQHYTHNQQLAVHGAGLVMGVVAIWITPMAILAAFIFTLLLMHYPCPNCIRYRWPQQLASMRSR